MATAGGAAIPGATVTAFDSNNVLTPYTTATDAAGAFSLSLRQGQYGVNASKFGYALKASSKVWVLTGQTGSVGTISLDAGGALIGTIRNAITDTPLLGATVSWGVQSILTDAAGQFEIRAAPASAKIQISKTGFDTHLTPDVYTVTAGQITAAGVLTLVPANPPSHRFI